MPNQSPNGRASFLQPCANQVPDRTLLTPPRVPAEPVASLEYYARRPYQSPDTSLIGNSIGKALDCGCGCNGAHRIARMRACKNKILISGSVMADGMADAANKVVGACGVGQLDFNNIYLMFIFMLVVIIIINTINLKHLAKQVKVLTKAATARGSAVMAAAASAASSA